MFYNFFLLYICDAVVSPDDCIPNMFVIGIVEPDLTVIASFLGDIVHLNLALHSSSGK